MRQELIRLLSAFLARKIDLKALERWVVTHIDEAAQAEPEVREVFDDLDGLLLARTVGEATPEEIWQAADGWLRRLMTTRVGQAGLVTGSAGSSQVESWEQPRQVRTTHRTFSVASG